MTRRRFDEDQVREMVRLHAEDEWTCARIAAAFRAHAATVSAILHGHLYTDVTGGLNVSRAHAVSAHRQAVVADGIAQGRTQTAIARELGITPSAVYQRATKLRPRTERRRHTD